MGNFGVGEMAIIAIFGLLVFGPQRLPEIARSVGGFIREFKAVAGGLTSEFKAETDAAPKAAKVEPPKTEPSPEIVESVEPARNAISTS